MGTEKLAHSEIRTKYTGKKLDEIDMMSHNSKISEQEVKDGVEDINIRKATGIDDIANFMIKFGGKESTKILKKLFNQIYKQGIMPKIWKKGCIIPIPKERNPSIAVDRFRPICLLLNMGKVMEKIINKRLIKVSERYGWIPTIQSGFRKRRTTIDNLIVLQQEIHGSFKKNEYCVAVFLDIKKAYDSVDREKLIKMLKERGLKGNCMMYLKQFLGKNRSNITSVNGEKSEELKFKYGLPQGSPLSPQLFNIYVSDITLTVKEKVLQFADDMVIWENGKDIKKIEENLNKKLKETKNYLASKNMELATNKCIPIIFTRKRKVENKPKLFINGFELPFKNKAKYLGLTFDKNLTWKYHIEEILKKCRKRIGILKTLCRKYKILQKDAIIIYKTVIRPVIEYASEVYGDVSNTNKKKLESIEHRAICTALGVNITSKKMEVNLEAKIEPLKIREKRKLIKTYIKKRDTDTGKYLKKSEQKRLNGKHRKSFIERIKNVEKEMELSLDKVDNLDEKKFNKLLNEEWKQNIEDLRNPEKFYFEIKNDKTYEQFANKRNTQRIWHQARLGVILTNNFLHKLKCKDTKVCKFDEHFIKHCKTYDPIWQQRYPKRMKNNPKTEDLKVLLNENKPPPIKKKIAECLLQTLIIRTKKTTRTKMRYKNGV